MLKFYVQAREAAYRLRNDERGVTSFEYVIVAALVIAAVGAAFGTGGPIQAALTSGIGHITTNMATALVAG
jgi:Flp pilus assembly pilin Flp